MLTKIARDDGHIVVQSSGQGRKTIFVHGLGEGRYHWDHVLAQLDGRGLNIAYDLRGHGDSSWLGDGRYTIEQHVTDLLAVIDQFPPEPFALVGHSMGGEIALRVAARGTPALCAVVLVDTGLSSNPGTIATLDAERRAGEAAFNTVSDFRAWLAVHRPLMAARCREAMISAALQPHPDGGFRMKRDPAAYGARAVERQAAAAAWAALAAVDCPLLVLRGAASSYLPGDVARMMAGKARRASLQTVARAGHGIATENPDGFLAAVVPFLEMHLWQTSAALQVRE